MSDLTADDPKKQSNAAWRLGGGGGAKNLDFSDPRIVDALLIALKDADQKVRGFSAWSLKFHLSRQSDPRIVEALTSTLSDKSNADRVHEEAFDALKTHTNSSIVAFAIPFLAHSNGTVRLNAATLLGASKDASAVEPLIAALKEKAEPSIIRALGEIGDPRAVDVLIEVLRSTCGSTLSHGVPDCAAESLGKICDSRAVDPLIAALTGAKRAAIGVSHYSSPRIDYITALRRLNATEAISAIKEYITDDNREVSRAAMESIEYLQKTSGVRDEGIKEVMARRRTLTDRCDELKRTVASDPGSLIAKIKEKARIAKGVVDDVSGIPYIYDDIKQLEHFGVPAVVPTLLAFGDASMIQRWQMTDLKERTAPMLISEVVCRWIKDSL